MGLIVAGVVAIIAGIVVLTGAALLHEPGLAGDSSVRILDGGAYAAVVGVAFGLVAVGVVLIAGGVRRRRHGSLKPGDHAPGA